MSLAPAVSRDGFSFAGGDLFAEASGHNRHRRASPAELKAHFAGGSDKDHPAHWFEAQLMHYGLQPSKTKAVARMRLYDAVRAGKLAVPAHLTALEADLKKQWTRAEREAKKVLSAGGGGGGASSSSKATAAKATKAGTKRKAEESSSNTIDLTVSVGGVDIKLSTNSKATKSASSSTTAASAAKKAKTTKTTAKETSKPKATPKSKETSKQKEVSKPKATPKATTASKSATSSTTKPKTSSSASKPKPSSRAPASSSTSKPAKTQTARRGGHSQGPGRSAASSSSTSVQPSGPFMARRSGASAARGRITAPTPSPQRGYGGGGDGGSGGFGYDDPPPPYSEYDDGDQDDRYSFGGEKSGYNSSSDDDDGYGFGGEKGGYNSSSDDDDDIELQPLGLLNGRYEVYSRDVTNLWGQWVDEDFSLVLTLRGHELWGRFDLGIMHGVLRLDRRPYQSSHERMPFTWRGRESDGGDREVSDGDRNDGWLRFLGDGRVEGHFDLLSLDFQAQRIPGQSTRSEIDANTLRSQWASHDRY